MGRTRYFPEIYLSDPGPYPLFWGPPEILGYLYRRMRGKHEVKVPTVPIWVSSRGILVDRGPAIPLSQITLCACEPPTFLRPVEQPYFVRLEYLADDGTRRALKLWARTQSIFNTRETQDRAPDLYDAIRQAYYEAHEASHMTLWQAYHREEAAVLQGKPLDPLFLPQGVPSTILRDIGVDARLVDYHYNSKGQHLIDIGAGPIRQLVAWYSVDHYKGKTNLDVSYLVTDSRIGPHLPWVFVTSVRIKKFPLFGPVIGVRWEEYGWGWRKAMGLAADVNRRLSQDSSVAKAIADTGDVTIGVSRDGGYWLLKPTSAPELPWRGPTRRQWDCYEAIAQHLLAMPIPTGE